jgi:CO/xanthine dehydrogenase Mo-binding subunit
MADDPVGHEVQQAEGDQDKYGNQNTDGSRSMSHWYEPMRRAAVAARLMLEQAAANQWDVPLREVRAEIHKVLHPATSRKLGFGELADAARELDVPGRHALVLKPDSELGMGFNTMPFDIPAIRLENPPAPAHVPIGWFRSVYNLHHA